MRRTFWRTWTTSLLAGAAACAAPTTAPAPAEARTTARAATSNPVEQLRRQHDEWWKWLAATYDRNGDGRIEPAEYGRDAATFARLDRDGDGVITRADFDRDLVLPPDLVLPMLLISLSGARDADAAPIETLLAGLERLDANRDGHVSRAEFEAGAGGGMAGVDGFGTLLAGMDDDRDGLVSLAEAERWMRRRDHDHDGCLARRERMVDGPEPAAGFIAAAERTAAPDFTARPLAGGDPVALKSLVGDRPVALIFGSFT